MGLHLQGMGKFQERTDGQGRGKSRTIKPKNVQTLTQSLVHVILSVSQKLDLTSVLLRKLLYSGVETAHKLKQLIVFLPGVSLSCTLAQSTLPWACDENWISVRRWVHGGNRVEASQMAAGEEKV